MMGFKHDLLTYMIEENDIRETFHFESVDIF